MNHLAHLLLADASEAWQMGALLGDFVRGRPATLDWRAEVIAGIEHHRALDSWTDRHPLIVELKNQAPQGLRRYMGIVLDLFLDGWLCRHWQSFHGQTLAEFVAPVYAMMERHHDQFPLRLQRFCQYAINYQVLSRYHEPKVMDRVLAGVAGRLSQPGPLANARHLLAAHEAQIDDAFAEFFPAAVSWSHQWVAKRKSTMSGS